MFALSDVFATGHHAAVKAGVSERTTVTVIGDGAVGLSAVLAARRLAERILLMGRHTARTDLGREFGATDVVADRGDEGIAKVGGLSSGEGARLLECVGTVPGFGWRGPCGRHDQPRGRPAVRRGPDRPCVPQQHHRHRRHRARAA
jgi:threonine dehydrogenase-like Zn-dependent dehydrogenase